MGTKRNFKDSLFRAIFKEKRELAELYYGLTGERVEDLRSIHLNTLEEVLVNGVHNDLSFHVGGRSLVLIEEQSTFNGNLPLRMLDYVAQLLRQDVSRDIIYREKRQMIAAPQFYAFYCDVRNVPLEFTQRLSEAFDVPSGDLELIVHGYNITAGGKQPLFRTCPRLWEYSTFVGWVDSAIKHGLSRDEAIGQSMTRAIETGVLKEFFLTHKREAFEMAALRWNLKDAKRVWQQEAMEDGREEGMRQGMERGMERGVAHSIRMIMKNTGATAEKAMEMLGIDRGSMQKYLALL